jgi:hypothetical protein
LPLATDQDGDEFLVKGKAHAVMMMGSERFELQREGDTLILHGRQTRPPIPLADEPLTGLE